MTDKFIRHFISLLATVIIFLAWFAGYRCGMNGWWWVGFGSLITYGAVYAALKV